ncbi:reverse transcriptase domain-containing protein, partial [Tanacetum coccineum]
MGYSVSKALKETEINYSAMEKLILALVFAAKRMRKYFQAHPIVVITDQPIKQVISKPDASGRLQKWSVLLGEHNISYRPCTAMKGQILADFLIEFISKGTLPHEQKDARRIRSTAQRFELRNGVLYRRSFLQPWLRCVGPIQADYVLREIHAGSCSMHSGPRSVVARALRSGYYWPTMHRDARDIIKKCNDCQGIDIAGPFLVAAGGLKFLIVAIDYFTKWIEAKAVATITWNQTNGLVERANRSLGEGIKARLDRHKGRWVEELSHVLWAHRTTIKVSTGDTPFSLVYGTEVVIPAEIGMPTIHTAEVNIATNDDERRIDLDILEE